MIDESLYRVPGIWVYRCVGLVAIVGCAIIGNDVFESSPTASGVFALLGVFELVCLIAFERCQRRLKELRRKILEQEATDGKDI